VAKTTAICVQFFPNVVCQKLLKSANVSESYLKNKSGTFFMNHGVKRVKHQTLQYFTISKEAADYHEHYACINVHMLWLADVSLLSLSQISY